MAALTSDRMVMERDGVFRAFPVEAGKLIYAGALVQLNAAGNAVPASSVAGQVTLGRAETRADNTGGAAGAIAVKVRRGIFNCVNSPAGADQITAAMVGATVYAVDDQTVAATSNTNTRSIAGTVYQVDGDGVWVKVG